MIHKCAYKDSTATMRCCNPNRWFGLSRSTIGLTVGLGTFVCGTENHSKTSVMQKSNNTTILVTFTPPSEVWTTERDTLSC